MAKPPSSLDLALDRNALQYLTEIGNEIVERVEQIRAKYPEGTFDELEEEGDDEPPASEPVPEPRRAPVRRSSPKRPKGRPPKKQYASLGLTDALRAWPRVHDGMVVVSEFKEQTDYKPNSIDGVIAGLARKGEFTKESPGVYRLNT